MSQPLPITRQLMTAISVAGLSKQALMKWLDELVDEDRNLLFDAVDSWRTRATEIAAADRSWSEIVKNFAESTFAKSEEFKSLFADQNLTADDWADRQQNLFRLSLLRPEAFDDWALGKRKPDTSSRNKRFWRRLKAELKGRNSFLADSRTPTHLSWWAFGIGTSRARLVLSVSRKFARVELDVRGDSRLGEKARVKDARKVFEYLSKHKDRIGEAYGGDLQVFADELKWDDSREKSLRIRAELPGVSIDNEESDWSAMWKWLVDRTIRMDRAFAGEFDKMPKVEMPHYIMPKVEMPAAGEDKQADLEEVPNMALVPATEKNPGSKTVAVRTRKVPLE